MRKRNWLVVGGIAVVAFFGVGAAGWSYHGQPNFCATCHIMDPYLESWNRSEFSVHDHAMEGVDCLDCHEPTIQQQVDELVKFVNDDYEIPLEERQFDNDWCLRCHEHGSIEEIIERTRDYEVNGEAANPHAPHANVEDMKMEEEPMECSNCHKMHRDSPGLKSCYTCHHMGTFQVCGDCHAGGVPLD